MIKVMAFGAFDPLHEGHRDFFRQAKQFGDYLIVVVARDKNIEKIKKHKSRTEEEERLEKVKKAENVDRAVLGNTDDYAKVIEENQPDIIVLGYDQEIPLPLKNKVKKYKIVTLKPFKPKVFKSSKIVKNS